MNRIEERRAEQEQRAPGAADPRPDLANAEPTAAFAALFDAYARALHGYLAGRVGVDVADDLVAETFLVALRRRASYDPAQAPVRGWLYGIATNLVRNHIRAEVRGYRASARVFALREAGADHDGQIVDRLDAQRHTRQLADGLAGLNEQERDVLLLTSWAGLEPTEVAVALGVPASTIRSRLHRVRHKLRAHLRTDEENRDD
ncbi:RNA polymerase sigma factor [Umezawaea sp. Da 62-37]|uniref:RNA polymerase sigma factor n=1 Tax=Umezawaea sp. Da 62-37 TaxID=3075927 RepID=UPI0028F6F0A4|nr:RNA polymerase sigma factor [Umezawaea sp. Da 62-37]WNV84475.1 RNA polymerase sigma factor [Umezawaea sp. Da 62-37]